jgi:hypothetical protein
MTFINLALLARPAVSIARQRGWLLFSTFFQALLLGAAALLIIYSQHNDEPGQGRLTTEVNWTDANGFIGLAFAAASVGLQGATAQRLRTPFGPAVPLTSTWVDMAIDPSLLELKYAYTREAKIAAILATFFGGFSGRALIQQVGSRWALGVAALIKLAMAFSWLVSKRKPEELEEK